MQLQGYSVFQLSKVLHTLEKGYTTSGNCAIMNPALLWKISNHTDDARSAIDECQILKPVNFFTVA
jgi:hypothetical protein